MYKMTTSAEAFFPGISQSFTQKKSIQSQLSIRHVIKERRSAHAVRSTLVEKVGTISATEHLYETTGDGTLRLEVTPSTESMFGAEPIDPALFSQVNIILSGRQNLYIPKAKKEGDHFSTILFLSRNWDRVRRLLYPFGAPGNIPPACFSEVVLDKENGHRADFIGFGPDGRVFIIEVGTREKSSQVQGYIESFRSLFNGKVSASPLVDCYSVSKTEKNIHIRPPHILGFQTAFKALDYVQELAAREAHSQQ